ncbi:hypothetical protein AVEN_168031-1 [Araneus ventricosus]|uniref:Uncharacterized protein n=1 Tax=Araneus ventricosus TaxID=182803 RepID=A0A4Y2JTB0_ARAVE|nr:hypothetical protein AVEN_168031-1 [Araneus ventricosus]
MIESQTIVNMNTRFSLKVAHMGPLDVALLSKKPSLYEVSYTLRSYPGCMSHSKRKPTVSFIQQGIDEYAKCYSENLHLYQSNSQNQIIKEVDSQTLSGHVVYRYNLSLLEEESFMPWGRPQAFFAIHSPFNPINPMYEGKAIRSGFTYVVEIKLLYRNHMWNVMLVKYDKCFLQGIEHPNSILKNISPYKNRGTIDLDKQEVLVDSRNKYPG